MSAARSRTSCVIGVDLGGTKLLAGVVGPDLAVRHRVRRQAFGLDQARLMATIVDAVEEARAEIEDEVAALGFGIPVTLDRRTGTAAYSTHLPLADVPFEAVMSEHLGLPVAVDNDANLAALGELTWGAGQGCEDLVYLKLHSGVGAGVVVNGQLARGAAGGAGEVGHIVLDPAGPQCWCGSRGCLQVYTSIPAVLAAASREAGRELTLGALVDGAAEPAIARVLIRAGDIAGRAMASVCNVLNPRRVIVGGGLARVGDVLIGPLRGALRANSLPLVGSNTEVVAAALGNEASALGGVALVLRESERLVPPGVPLTVR
jgi:glucokinase